MNFHDINFPKFMEIFAVGKPVFSTSLASTISGIELRNSDREYALQKYIFKNCCLSPAQFDEFNIFFRARKGRDCSFRFRDLLDQYAYKQVLAVGDGMIKEAQLFKEYRDQITSYMRKITKPVKDSVKLYIDDKLIQANIEYNTGVIGLAASLNKYELLTADFQFDVPVRFLEDFFDYSYRTDGSIALTNIELIEVVE